MRHFVYLGLATAIFAVGCTNKSTDTVNTDSSAVMNSAPPASAGAHAHPTEGPHHGTLIELGNEEYHAELVHDDELVTIYILDAAAAKAAPIDASDVSINLVHNGKPEQYKLVASQDSSDPAGRASQFVCRDAELVEELEHDHAVAKLSLLIDGKAYRGEIHHDHAGHAHLH